MNADGTQQRMLTSAGKNNFAPTFSPDGKQLAFVSDRDGNKEIYVMNAAGSNQKRLTSNLVDDTSPIWR
jgi:TolB protein